MKKLNHRTSSTVGGKRTPKLVRQQHYKNGNDDQSESELLNFNAPIKHVFKFLMPKVVSFVLDVLYPTFYPAVIVIIDDDDDDCRREDKSKFCRCRIVESWLKRFESKTQRRQLKTITLMMRAVVSVQLLPHHI